MTARDMAAATDARDWERYMPRFVLDQRMGGYPAQRVVLAGKLVR